MKVFTLTRTETRVSCSSDEAMQENVRKRTRVRLCSPHQRERVWCFILWEAAFTHIWDQWSNQLYHQRWRMDRIRWNKSRKWRIFWLMGYSRHVKNQPLAYKPLIIPAVVIMLTTPTCISGRICCIFQSVVIHFVSFTRAVKSHRSLNENKVDFIWFAGYFQVVLLGQRGQKWH